MFESSQSCGKRQIIELKKQLNYFIFHYISNVYI